MESHGNHINLIHLNFHGVGDRIKTNITNYHAKYLSRTSFKGKHKIKCKREKSFETRNKSEFTFAQFPYQFAHVDQLLGFHFIWSRLAYLYLSYIVPSLLL